MEEMINARCALLPQRQLGTLPETAELDHLRSLSQNVGILQTHDLHLWRIKSSPCVPAFVHDRRSPSSTHLAPTDSHTFGGGEALFHCCTWVEHQTPDLRACEGGNGT
jgi:hypothetical protein